MILIAMKKGDTIYMGTDTRIIVGDSKRNEISECNCKIQKLENGMLLGVTGERIEKQTLIAYSEIFTLDKKGQLTRRHIIKEIIPKLMEMLAEEELLVEKEGEMPYMKADICLAYKDVLYEISPGFAVFKYEDYQVVGRESNYAQATIMNTKDSDDINERIIKALDITSVNSYHVGRPYVLIDTKNLEYKFVKGDN